VKKFTFQWSIFLYRLLKLSAYFSAFLSFRSCKIYGPNFFYDFFNFWHIFRGPKPSKKWKFFKPFPSAKIISKIVFYALKNPKKHVFTEQKFLEDPKPATPYTGRCIYMLEWIWVSFQKWKSRVWGILGSGKLHIHYTTFWCASGKIVAEAC